MENNSVLQAIHSRRSIRKYKDKALSQEQIKALLDAALISPSAMNRQPWHITVLTNKSIILEWEKEIVQYFVDTKNEKMVEHNKARGNKIFYDAPVVFVISMEDGKGIDVGIMAQSIALAAKGMGIDSVILGLPRVSFDPKYEGKWYKTLKFPENHVYGISVAVGYGDEPGRQREIDMSKVSYVD
ncbi:MAG: nitroreductase [Clostridiales bacterium]|nr:nitroreductase [Clostridiales bacterium]